jgi:hypothetical protein
VDDGVDVYDGPRKRGRRRQTHEQRDDRDEPLLPICSTPSQSDHLEHVGESVQTGGCGPEKHPRADGSYRRDSSASQTDQFIAHDGVGGAWNDVEQRSHDGFHPATARDQTHHESDEHQQWH